MEDKMDWINRRVEEMEEKAGVTQLPKIDMDGTRFQVDDDEWECNEREDAYVQSISCRMGWAMGQIHPTEMDEFYFERWMASIERATGYNAADFVAMRIYPYDDFEDGIKPGQFIKDYDLKKEPLA